MTTSKVIKRSIYPQLNEGIQPTIEYYVDANSLYLRVFSGRTLLYGTVRHLSFPFHPFFIDKLQNFFQLPVELYLDSCIMRPYIFSELTVFISLANRNFR